MTYANGVVHRYTYDTRNRLTFYKRRKGLLAIRQMETGRRPGTLNASRRSRVCHPREAKVKNMKGFLRWKAVLPTLNAIAAVCMWFYIPIQFEKEITKTFNLVRVRHGLPPTAPFEGHPAPAPEVFDRHFPPPIGRMLYSINLPAYVLSNKAVLLTYYRPIPAWRFVRSIRVCNGARLAEVTYDVGIEEVTFILALVFLWYWVGSKIDALTKRTEAASTANGKRFQMAEMAISLTVSVLLFRECLHLLLAPDCLPPLRQIMACGLIWPVLFLAYSCFMFVDRARSRVAH